MPLFLQRRSIVSLVVALAFLLAAVFAAAALFENQSRSQQLLEHALTVEEQISRVLSSLQDAETGQRGFLLTNDAAYLQPYRSGTSNLETAIEVLGGQFPTTNGRCRLWRPCGSS